MKNLKTVDIIAAIGVLALALFFIISARGGEGRAKKLVLLSGDKTINLMWKTQTIELNDLVHKNMTIEVEKDRARVISSDCPDKVCVHSGWVSDCGHVAACLPNGVLLMVDCRGDLNVTEPQ